MNPADGIYLDNHATTRVDPRVIEAMLPTFDQDYANAGSVTHRPGQIARDRVAAARNTIASFLGASNDNEIVLTSGATESNNLALRGFCQRLGAGHIISSQTEHQAVLVPLQRLEQSGFSVTRLPVLPAGDSLAGQIDLDQLAAAIRPDTILVSIMMANNEIGTIQPIAEISHLCRERNIALHCDATQAIGWLPIDVEQLGVDLLSFSGHKIHGPKGVGGLFVRSHGKRIRLVSQIDGGGQELGRRGGTLNVSGIVGLAKACELCQSESLAAIPRVIQLRKQLYERLQMALGDLPLNGPPLENTAARLPQNLNCQFPGLDGHSLMVASERLALSSGSACTATSTEPSHVLAALGLNRDQIRSSLRFGLSRMTTEAEINAAVEMLADAARQLRKLGGVAVR